MLMEQILNKLDINKLKYEIIKNSPSCKQEIFNKAKEEGKELVRTLILNVDGNLKLVFISDNFGLNIENIQRALNANKIEFLGEDTDSFKNFLKYDYTTLIDQNLLDISEEIILQWNAKEQLIKVNTSDFKSMIQPAVIDFSLLPKYRAKINSVSPKSNRYTFANENTACFFGVSLENSNFIRPKLMASLEWVVKHFKKCTILIGDSIHRITLETVNKFDKTKSLNTALTLGREFLQREKAIFKKYSKNCEFDFLLCSEIQAHKEYDIFHKNIKNIFESNKDFRDSVKLFGEKYHIKRRNFLTINEWNYYIQRSCDYFLEEFSIFATIQKNLPVMIYPGSFSTLTEISEGKYQEAPNELKNLIIVSLQLKQR
jgi:tRNA-dependent cyclodipeptide synthase